MGFIIGCCEALEYIAYVSSSIISLGSMITAIVPSLLNYVALGIHFIGGKFF